MPVSGHTIDSLYDRYHFGGSSLPSRTQKGNNQQKGQHQLHHYYFYGTLHLVRNFAQKHGHAICNDGLGTDIVQCHQTVVVAVHVLPLLKVSVTLTRAARSLSKLEIRLVDRRTTPTCLQQGNHLTHLLPAGTEGSLKRGYGTSDHKAFVLKVSPGCHVEASGGF